MRYIIATYLLITTVFFTTHLCAQTYSPVPLTGFNNDVFAEAGTDAAAVTSVSLDLSNHVMYTANFAATNGLSGGVLNSGTIVNGTRTYQLAPYDANNILYLSSGGAVPGTLGSGTVSLSTPAYFTHISLLLFSSEDDSRADVVLNFTDGTTLNAGNFFIQDWFFGTGAMYTGFGRIARLSAPPYTVNGYPADPRFYSLDIPLNCTDRAKQLQSITLTHTFGNTSSSRISLLALSGVGYTPMTATTSVTGATCNSSNGSIQLIVAGGTPPLSYSWNTTPVQTTATATNLAAGNYTCTITDAGGCTITATATVPQASATTLTATANPATICSGQTTNLVATATGGTVTGYTWSPGNLTGSTVTVSPAASTTYTVSGQDNNGCTVSATVAVTVNPMPTSAFTVSPSAVCQGTSQTVSFTGSAGSTATYNWNFNGATIQSGTGAGPYTILFNTPGNYTVELQVTETGCTSTTSTQPVTVSSPVTAGFQVSSSTICSGTTINVTFTGSAASTATPVWNWGGGIVQSGTGFGPFTVQYNSTGTITLTVNDGTCTSTASPQTITVIPSPVAAFTTDVVKGCPPAIINFTSQSQHADTYQWNFGDGGTSTDPDPQYTYNSTGIFTVTLTVTSQGQCTDVITKTDLIRIDPAPIPFFTSNPDTYIPLELHLASFSFSNASQNADSYKWNFGDGTTSSAVNPVYHYRFPGNYRVTLYAMNSAGCIDSFSREFYTVLPDKILVIPNAFSPNGDGTNDRWDINGLRGYPDCTIEIFNRWGQPVFYNRGYTAPWDGTYKGSALPVATYYYVIKTSIKTYTGWVALIR